MELSRRQATESDKAFVREAMRRAYRDVVIHQFGTWDDNHHNRRFDDKWLYGGFEVVELAGESIGAIWTTYEASYVRLRDLFLVPAFQGRGIGSRLMNDELTKARRLGKPLRLRVLKENRARALYRRLGFSDCGETARQNRSTFASISPAIRIVSASPGNTTMRNQKVSICVASYRARPPTPRA